MYFSEHLQTVSKFFSSLNSKDIDHVLEDIMTPQEIVELGERLELLKRLQS
jgi:hypothetical protein